MSTTAQAQSFTLATAVNLGSEWTNAESRKLETLRASQMSISDIAKELGRSYYSVSTRLINLGLARTNRNTAPEPVKVPACPNCFIVPAANGTCGCDAR